MKELSVKNLFEAGVHFGHQSRRWNPKMEQYIYGTKDKIHIINLDKTLEMMNAALKIVTTVAAEGGRILFVGTKRQACDFVAESATKCGQYYVNHRWLGGMLTNWKTVSQSIKKIDALELRLKDPNVVLKKKEYLNLERELSKLNKVLGGVRTMGGSPSLLFVLDVTMDKTAVEEAKVLGIPVIGICDTNSDPTTIDYPIPGNDDSIRAIKLYCDLVEDAVIGGIQKGLTSAGVDVGTLEDTDILINRAEKDEVSSENDANKGDTTESA